MTAAEKKVPAKPETVKVQLKKATHNGKVGDEFKVSPERAAELERRGHVRIVS